MQKDNSRVSQPTKLKVPTIFKNESYQQNTGLTEKNKNGSILSLWKNEQGQRVTHEGE